MHEQFKRIFFFFLRPKFLERIFAHIPIKSAVAQINSEGGINAPRLRNSSKVVGYLQKKSNMNNMRSIAGVLTKNSYHHYNLIPHYLLFMMALQIFNQTFHQDNADTFIFLIIFYDQQT